MRLPADQRRTQLLDVARDVFAARGFHAASMDEIAEAAGVTKPVVYQHFPSKRALYVELLHDTRERLLTSLRAATGRAPTGRARVEEGFAAYFRFVTSNRSGFRLLFSASVRNDPEFAAIAEDTIETAADAITVLIEIPVPDEQRRVLAHALVGMSEAAGRRALADDRAEQDPEAMARWVSELAWFGLRGVRAGETASSAPSGPAAASR